MSGIFQSIKQAMPRFASEPRDPDVVASERALLRDFLDKHRLPGVVLRIQPLDGASPIASRIGGPAWRPDGADWPLDHTGAPMYFLAQVNFSELPPLPDFPRAGLLQFFVAADAISNIPHTDGRDPDVSAIASGVIAIDWHPSPSGGAQRFVEMRRRRQTPFQRDYSQGWRWVAGEREDLRPDLSTYLFDDYHRGVLTPRLGDFGEDIYEPVGDDDLEYHEAHVVGGHAVFVQEDIRVMGDWREFDRVLLRVGCDDREVMFGDGGIANFMIRQQDLRNQDFSHVIFTWDCS